jgi:hypothetical protein
MDINTLLWGALFLFMIVCCGMMMRRPPSGTSRGTAPRRDDASLMSKADKEKQ